MNLTTTKIKQLISNITLKILDIIKTKLKQLYFPFLLSPLCLPFNGSAFIISLRMICLAQQ